MRALLLVGFRPFFLLACLAGVAYPLAWAAVFSGRLSLPAGAPTALAWHAHELFFGFGFAVLGGFLLTASKNWVSVRGLHGPGLAVAVALWLVERVVVLFGAELPTPLRLVLLHATVAYVGGYVGYTLVRHRRRDTFRDNGYFLVLLPVLLGVKAMLLHPEQSSLGAALALGLFRVAFVVMFERTFPPFAKGAMGIELPRRAWLDRPVKLFALLSVAQPLLPAPVGAALLTITALLLLGRLATWHPLRALARFDVGVMYAGSLGLSAHLLLTAAVSLGLWTPLGSLTTHSFVFLCLGPIVAHLFLRIGQGHTGRKITFTRVDRVALASMALGAFARLVLTQLDPARYSLWIAVAAAGFAGCFALVFVRLAPWLVRPRVDGKEH